MLIFCYAISFCNAAAQIEKNILVLLPHTPDFPLHTDFNKGLQQGFQNNTQYKVNYSYEYFGLAHHTNEKYLADTAQYFKAKYERHQPDLIIAGGELNQFILNYGKNVFPTVPMIIVWDQDTKELREIPEDVTVVTGIETDNYNSNIRNILQLNPLTAKIYIVVGDSSEEQRVVGELKQTISKYPQVEFAFLNKLPYDQMLECVGNASDNSAILFIRWVTDVKGKNFIPEQVLEAICREVQAPVYATIRHAIGKGIVGGHLYNYELVGRNIAQYGVQIFEGRQPSEVILENVSPNEYVFDWRALKRWGISEKRLPQGSIIEYRESSIWDLYKWYIIGGIILFLIETALILALLANRTRRKKAENNLMHLNMTLENRVSERTQELQDKNVQLKMAHQGLELLNQQLDLISRTDALTGLYNRRHMESKIQEEFAKYLSNGSEFAIIIADIDSFKKVNDVYGHDAGDCLLRCVSEDIRKLVRKSDTVARWGGEEFLLLLPATVSENAKERAERIRSTVEKKVYFCGEVRLSVTLTLGVSVISKDDTIANVIKRADYSLYQGKRAGRNCVVFLDTASMMDNYTKNR
ncbi:ABC transporter substrate binding protein [Dendrosporobacter sp. 1207_IL3150]|uniref:ABC transporter substrate binding protein n=1 Tax=Dendrosporobacter sp. 1207_IL3150 TaxID=3084054 RepID=UPI002FDA79C3